MVVRILNANLASFVWKEIRYKSFISFFQSVCFCFFETCYRLVLRCRWFIIGLFCGTRTASGSFWSGLFLLTPLPRKRRGENVGCESFFFFFPSTVLGGKGRGLIFRQEGPCWAQSYLVFFIFYFICQGKDL